MKIKKVQLLENVGFDMTPMIDCVFQLIIFFMLTIDFANTQLERVQLPKAVTSMEDKNPPEKRLMINLAHLMPEGETGDCKDLKYDNDGNLTRPCGNEKHWKIKVAGESYEPAQLEAYLTKQGGLVEGRDPPDPSNPNVLGLSRRFLMIRSDAGATYQMLEKVFAACARARIWKIELGASKPQGQ